MDGSHRVGGRLSMEYLPSVMILAIIGLMIAAMLWLRPDPRHEFALEILKLLADVADAPEHDDARTMVTPEFPAARQVPRLYQRPRRTCEPAGKLRRFSSSKPE